MGEGGGRQLTPAEFEENRRGYEENLRNQEAREKAKRDDVRNYSEARAALIQDHFSCPTCKANRFSVVTRDERRRSTSGVLHDYTVQVPDHYECDGCSTRFGDPARYTVCRQDLAEDLNVYDAASKPGWLK